MPDHKDLFGSKLKYELKKPDETIFRKIKENWDSVSKPIDGLGDFEDLLCRLGSIQGTDKPRTKNRTALIFCADNGIIEEGVSQSGKDITLAVAKALGSGISSACHLGAYAGVRILPVDIGIDSDEKIEGVLDRKVARGTKNFLKESAMTEEETLQAIETGIALVKDLKEDGTDLISTGEMGIGNTTTSTACLAALLKENSDAITGRGAGLDDAGLNRKKAVIAKALETYDFGSCKDEKERAFEILRTLGGLDIAALVGTFLGGAIHRVPIVIDGVISATAACLAEAILPGTADYMIPSHSGRESGTALALKHLGLKPYLAGNMALGEGTGAIMLFPLLDMVLDYYSTGARFADYEIKEYERFDQ